MARFCFACGVELNAPSTARPVPPADSAAERLQRLVPREFAERLLATRGQVARERRTVTILFSDVVGSTALAEDLDPEDVMEIMDGAFDVLIEPVYRYEGTVARLMGDAILAFFGAPIAHEDDPERACRAALDIVAGAQSYAQKLEQERGIQSFDVRVGVHTGLVVVGEVGTDLRVEYTAMGDAINLASRMESAAGPGTVLITEDTHKLVAPLFETEALGPIEVKGKAIPVPVYRVLAPKEVPGKLRGIAGLESPLVGREVEFGALREAVERLQNGVGGIVTVVGEAGIGKSRLVAEVQSGALHWVGATHLTWIEGRCLSYGASIAYLLWLDVLRGLLGVTIEDGPEDVRQALEERVRALCPEQYDDVYPYLARLMSLPLEEEVQEYLNDLDGRTLRERTFAAVETLLACTAQDRPLVVVCEDLHWADPTSLQLLEHLFPLTTRLPLLFLCPFRPVQEHRVWQTWERLVQDEAYAHTDLWLEPLSAADSQELVSNLLWVEGLPPALKERILSRAEGNPFYLEEILRSLIDQSAIVQDPSSGQWQAMAGVEEIAIPDTLEGVLVARIDRLQEETRRVLQLASVIGRIFLYRILGEIAQAERNLDGELSTLRQEELIRERAQLPELEYIFKHDLTREAAYNGLLKRHRRAYHRQVAGALESLFPDRAEEQLGILAHHWERAGDAEKAVEYLQRAGDQARLAYAHEEAVDYYQRALAFLEELEDHERAARTQMKLGLTHDSAFDFQRGREAYEAGFALWQRATMAGPAVGLPPAPHGLRLFWWQPPRLDPLLGGGLAGQFYSGLVDHTPNLSIVPDVAASWEVLDGGRRYLFHLREDVFWSDSVPVTAGDFECAWRRTLNPSAGREDAGLLYDIQGARDYHQGRSRELGVRALDDATLSVELEGPTGYLLHLLACWVAYPVPRHVVEARGSKWADPERLVTNGPFTLASWQPGNSMALERYPRYHGLVAGNVDRVEITFFQTEKPSAPVDTYLGGLSDVLQLPAEQSIETMDRLRKTHAPEWVALPSANTGAMIFDVARPPFDDARVRRAFAHAMDRGRQVDVTWGGYWETVTGGYVPPGMPGHVPGIALAYDPERARELLAETGYPGGADFPEVEFWAAEHWRPDPGILEDHLDLVRQWNNTLNLDIRPRYGSRSAKYGDSIDSAPPHIYFSGWIIDYPDPDCYLRVALQDLSAWRHEPYLELVERARRSLDQQERMALYAQAEGILAEEAPILPMDYDRKHHLIKPWVRRYPRAANGRVFWKDVVIEEH